MDLQDTRDQDCCKLILLEVTLVGFAVGLAAGLATGLATVFLGTGISSNSEADSISSSETAYFTGLLCTRIARLGLDCSFLIISLSSLSSLLVPIVGFDTGLDFFGTG